MFHIYHVYWRKISLSCSFICMKLNISFIYTCLLAKICRDVVKRSCIRWCWMHANYSCQQILILRWILCHCSHFLGGKIFWMCYHNFMGCQLAFPPLTFVIRVSYCFRIKYFFSGSFCFRDLKRIWKSFGRNLKMNFLS